MNLTLKNKFCLLALRSRSINDFSQAEELCADLSDFGYRFDEVKLVSYDSAEAITAALRDCRRYENLFVLCPADMRDMLSAYIAENWSAEFDGLGVLQVGESSVFLLSLDGENRLRLDDIRKILDGKYGVRYFKSCIRFVGASGEEIARAIDGIRAACSDLSVSVTGKFGVYRLGMTYTDSTPKAAVDGAARAALTELKDYVYSLEDEELNAVLYRLLKLRRMRLSVAESFTGGGVAKRMVEVPGVSEVFFEGISAYSNESKMSRLGVNELTLRQHGAVSDETAYEMTAGLLKTGCCEVALSTTGIAGPASDNTSKPVGLIYIGVGTAEGISVFRYNLKGDRRTVTETAINLALFHIYKALK